MSDAQAPGTPEPASMPPVTPSFDALGLHPDLVRGVRDMGFVIPTPIQAQIIPVVLEGRDAIGCAQTGSGKTAAFMLPIVHRLLQQPPHKHMRALVIAPTRELALQTMTHLKGLSRHVTIRGVAIFGGAPMDLQIKALREGVDVVSATPGRLLDHIYSGRVDFVDLQVLVLDEVDRMLDMGFLPDMRRIISLLPPQRQTLVFSATLPKEIEVLLKDIVRDPVLVQVGERSAPASGVRQTIYAVPRNLKIEFLTSLLRQPSMESVLVFTRTKIFADRLGQTLQRQGFRVSVIHGDRSQSQRLYALRRFREGRSQVLVATDIAARGIDIENISHVVNFDVPHVAEDYVHRIGRTARADATGDAVTLMAPDEEEYVQEIERMLKRTFPRLQPPGLPAHRLKDEGDHSRGGGAARRSGAQHGGGQRHGGGSHRDGSRHDVGHGQGRLHRHRHH